jgi:hypothetical protein
MPPLAVVVRRARPVVTFVGLAAWVFYRLFCIQNDQTLLQLWVELVATTRMQVLSRLGHDYPGTTLGIHMNMNHVLIPAVEWLFRIAQDIMAFILVSGLARLLYCLVHYSMQEWNDAVLESLFQWASEHVPVVTHELRKQTDNFNADAEKILHKNPARIKTLVLPVKGRSRQQVLVELETCATLENKKWQTGKVSGTVYSDDPAHSGFLSQVYGAYSWSNPLHPGYWPKLQQCESEVIAMTNNMLHGPSPGIGCMTSGGTESIMLAIRAHLVHYGKRRGIVYPEIVCGTTAHAAVNKACEVFGIRQVAVDCNDGQTYQLKPEAVRRHITANTIMIYASAPTYPQGVIDPIPELSEIALEYDIGLHVDACLGGFVLPFCDDAPVFDFRCEGVTSMSADTHKYGFSTKGTSVVMYNSQELRHGQYFA